MRRVVSHPLQPRCTDQALYMHDCTIHRRRAYANNKRTTNLFFILYTRYQGYQNLPGVTCVSDNQESTYFCLLLSTQANVYVCFFTCLLSVP